MPAERRIIPLTGAEHPLPERPDVFEHIAVVGLGLIGGSIALAARQVWPGALVIGVDTNQVLEQAVARHAVDVASSDLAIVSEADLVILAAPVLENVRLLSVLPKYLDRPAVLTDVGSTKRRTIEAARALPPQLAFVGGHPLAGSTRRGLEGARADLFAGRPWLFTPDTRRGHRGRQTAPTPGATSGGAGPAATSDAEDAGAPTPLERLIAFAEGLGAVPRVLGPAEHDHLVAFVSDLPQMTATALMHVVGDAVGEEGLALSGRGLQDTTRLAGSPADIWGDICDTNADEIVPAIDALVEALRRLRQAISDGKPIEGTFEAANRWRSLLEERRQ